MKFRDARSETKTSIEMVCLILSLTAIFFQIWILASCLEAYFQGHQQRLLPYVFLSLAGFMVCVLTGWTTGMSFMKGAEEGRSQTYSKETSFQKQKK